MATLTKHEMISMFENRWFWRSFAGSFGVYLLPLVGPHGFWFFGAALLREVTAAGGRDPVWIATDVALGLALQTIAALILAWSLRGGRARLVIWPIAIPLLFLGLQYAYLVTIPSRFLIERDVALERQEWAEHCVVRDASLAPIRTPISVPAQSVDNWWIQHADGGYALLRLPGCGLTEARLPQPTKAPDGTVDFMLSFQFGAGGAAII